MLNWIVTLFLCAVVTAVLGFSGLSGAFVETAKLLAIMFVVLFVGALLYSIAVGHKTNTPFL